MRPVALAAACALVATAAHADVIYSFTGAPAYVPMGGFPALGLDITLDVLDSAAPSGAFTLAGDGVPAGQAPSFRGTAAVFVSLSSNMLAGTVTPAIFDDFQRLDLSLTLDPVTGDVTGTVFSSLSGTAGEVRISGTGASASGAIGSDSPGCNSSVASGYCAVSGSWTHRASAPVPEPATLALLGSGLLALAAARPRACRHALRMLSGGPMQKVGPMSPPDR